MKCVHRKIQAISSSVLCKLSYRPGMTPETGQTHPMPNQRKRLRAKATSSPCLVDEWAAFPSSETETEWANGSPERKDTYLIGRACFTGSNIPCAIPSNKDWPLTLQCYFIRLLSRRSWISYLLVFFLGILGRRSIWRIPYLRPCLSWTLSYSFSKCFFLLLPFQKENVELISTALTDRRHWLSWKLYRRTFAIRRSIPYF